MKAEGYYLKNQIFKNDVLFEFPNKLEEIFDFLNKNGARPIVVGGFVRDTLLGRKNAKDIDVEVYNVKTYKKLTQLLKPYGKLNFVGKSFGICKITIEDYEIDFSLPRKENKIAQGHKGFVVSIDTSLSFKEAARRRDFTINAIGYDPIIKELLDFYDGIEDLQRKLLRMVDPNTFEEDPLRFFRAVGFAARFDLTLEQTLFKTLQKMVTSQVLQELPKERIFTELQKLFLRSKHPSYGIKLLRELKEITYFREIVELDEQVFFSFIKAFDRVKEKEMLYYMALLALHCDIERFTNDKRLLKEVSLLVSHYKEVLSFVEKGWSDFDLKFFATKVSWKKMFVFLEALYPTVAFEPMKQRVKQLGIYHNPLPPKVTGKDLIAQGLQPSKEFKKILHELYIKQLKEEN